MLGALEVWVDVHPRPEASGWHALWSHSCQNQDKILPFNNGLLYVYLDLCLGVYNILKLIIGISGHMVTCVQCQEFCFYQTSMEHPVIKKKKKKNL